MVAATILATLALIWSPRPAAAPHVHECPPPAAGLAAIAPAPEHCHHVQAGPCGDMLGCVATAPAMLTAASGVRLLAAHLADLATPTPALHGRLALGPPTPPPNS